MIRLAQTRTLFLIATLLCEPSRGHQANPSGDPVLAQTGIILPHELCPRQPGQSYALYLPSNYSAAQRWPIVYVFDPAARGALAVERMKGAAERYGFIIVGSNNSRNGPWKPEIEAAQAISDDTHMRFSIDDARVYFAGFSGGARVASRIAMLCKCAAGVMLNGAGFPLGEPPPRDATFPVFAAVGDVDFNYPEVTRLDQTLNSLGYVHALRYFEGPHQWAPPAVMNEAFVWFRIIAMKQRRELRDTTFIAAQRDAAVARARTFEQSGDLYAALREYRQVSTTFEGIADVRDLQRKTQDLAQQKLVRDAAKRESREFDQQALLVADISSSLNSLRLPSADRSGIRSDLNRRISELRDRISRETRPDQARVLQRAMADVFAQAMEAGLGLLAGPDNDYGAAKYYFQLALSANPDSSWALNNLAAACALTGDRKGAIDALRRGREQAPDPVAFAEWAQNEPAFLKLRDDAQFRSLLIKP